MTTFVVNIKDMSQYHLAEFEEIVLLTTAIPYGKGYGISMIEEIEGGIERNASLGVLQTVLNRVEEKGLLQSLQVEEKFQVAQKSKGFIYGMLFPNRF